MHPATDQFPPGREGVERLFEALAGVPEGALVFLDRRYDPGEQARRDAAWERVLEEAAFRHRDGAIDEIRAAAIQHVTLSRSRGLESTSYGLTPSGPLDRPEAQARVVNAIIEAAGAILVADLVEDGVVDVLAGPVLDLLATFEEERAAGDCPSAGRCLPAAGRRGASGAARHLFARRPSPAGPPSGGTAPASGAARHLFARRPTPAG